MFGNSFKAIVKVRFEKKSSVKIAKRQAGKHERKKVDFKASHLRAKKPKRCCALHVIFLGGNYLTKVSFTLSMVL